MADITAAMVRDLRDRTDAPMMECKKALVEADGDSARAEELLRVRLGNRASKAATRTAAEGVVAVHVVPDARTGAIVELSCETDFVAKTDEFRRFAQALAELAASKKAPDLAAFGTLSLGTSTVEDARKALVGRIGENMSIRRFARVEAQGRLAQYVHPGSKIGVLLDYNGGDEQLGKDLAMHVAASKPIGLTAKDIPQDVVKKERDIAAAKAAESGKPANIAEKMVEGSVQKFLKEVTLHGQIFVKDPNGKQAVEALLKGRGASVSRFVLYIVGAAESK